MSEFARGLARPGIAWLAPRAFGASWYPQSFLAPLDTNQPWLDSALLTLERLTNELFREAQLDRERVVLLGFSQGACLATEFMARTGGRWGGLAALSGGLIGPPGTERSYHRSLEGTPAFFGCGDPDLHIPRKRVEESGQVFSGLGADVDVRFYPGLGHAVNTDEVDEVRRIIEAL